MEDTSESLRPCANSNCDEVIPFGTFACRKCWGTVFLSAHDAVASEAIRGAKIAINALAYKTRVLPNTSI